MDLEGILEGAIQGEVESYELYTAAVELVETPHIQDMLKELAQEELGHKAKLEMMLADPDKLRRRLGGQKAEPVVDYKVADHLVSTPLRSDSTFQDVCIFAAKKEQQSYELYRDLAAQTEGEAHDLLEAMAQDELRHKNLVERWYEDVVYQEF